MLQWPLLQKNDNFIPCCFLKCHLSVASNSHICTKITQQALKVFITSHYRCVISYNVTFLFIPNIIKQLTFLTDGLGFPLPPFLRAFIANSKSLGSSDSWLFSVRLCHQMALNDRYKSPINPLAIRKTQYGERPRTPIQSDEIKRRRNNNLRVSCTCCIFTEIASQIKPLRNLIWGWGKGSKEDCLFSSFNKDLCVCVLNYLTDRRSRFCLLRYRNGD